MKAQGAIGNVIGENERARSQIGLGHRPARIAGVIPDGGGALDADGVIFCARARPGFSVGDSVIKCFQSRRQDAPVAAVTRLPLRPAQPLPHVGLTIAPIVTGMAVDDEVSTY